MPLAFRTHGPDTRTSQGSCAKCGRHHAGETSGFDDGCCCCDPCRYVKTWGFGRGDPGTPQEDPRKRMRNTQCCRCVPKMICIIFTPAASASGCCHPVTVAITPVHITDPPISISDTTAIKYTGTLFLHDFTFYIAHDAYTDECKWTLISESLNIFETIPVDHIKSTCLDLHEEIVITGVTLQMGIYSCPGSIRFETYKGAKMPFQNRFHDGTGPIDPWIGWPHGGTSEIALPIVPIIPGSPDSPCHCDKVSRVLCVNGRRHVDGPVESVEFYWNMDLQDRWSYLKPCGDRTRDQEHIYLRGDNYDNCYLELDFEQTGGDTNDWASPPNTLGLDPQEVRDGMIPIDICTCGLYVRTETTGDRFVSIKGGHCERFAYACGDCRCLPLFLCASGMIGGVFVESTLRFNEERLRWEGSYIDQDVAVPSPIQLTVSFAFAKCPTTPPGGFSDRCALVANVDDPYNNMEASYEVECSEYISAEMSTSPKNIGNGLPFNFLRVSGATCSCTVTECGGCVARRCDGPPLTLYADLEAEGIPRQDNLLTAPTSCLVPAIPLIYSKYWRRVGGGIGGLDGGGALAPGCSWVGFVTFSCPDPPDGQGDFVLRLEFSGQEGFDELDVWKYKADGTIEPWYLDGHPREYISPSCDPVFLQTDFGSDRIREGNTWPGQTFGTYGCFWACRTEITRERITVTE